MSDPIHITMSFGSAGRGREAAERPTGARHYRDRYGRGARPQDTSPEPCEGDGPRTGERRRPADRPGRTRSRSDDCDKTQPEAHGTVCLRQHNMNRNQRIKQL